VSRILVLVTVLIFCGGSALAQSAGTAPPPGAHPMMNGPCAADRQKYCKGVQPGGGKVVNCLVTHKAQLAPACRTRTELMLKMRDQMRSTTAPPANMQSKPTGSKPPG